MIKQNVQDASSVSSRVPSCFSKPLSFPHPMFKSIHRKLSTAHISQMAVRIAVTVLTIAYLVH